MVLPYLTLEQEEQQLHLPSAVPGRSNPISSPGAAGQVLCNASIDTALLGFCLAWSFSFSGLGVEAGAKVCVSTRG